LAEDEDLEQDSEAYRKWRSGNDNDKYASSKTLLKRVLKAEAIQYQKLMMNMHFLEKKITLEVVLG